MAVLRGRFKQGHIPEQRPFRRLCIVHHALKIVRIHPLQVVSPDQQRISPQCVPEPLRAVDVGLAVDEALPLPATPFPFCQLVIQGDRRLGVGLARRRCQGCVAGWRQEVLHPCQGQVDQFEVIRHRGSRSLAGPGPGTGESQVFPGRAEELLNRGTLFLPIERLAEQGALPLSLAHRHRVVQPEIVGFRSRQVFSDIDDELRKFLLPVAARLFLDVRAEQPHCRAERFETFHLALHDPPDKDHIGQVPAVMTPRQLFGGCLVRFGRLNRQDDVVEQRVGIERQGGRIPAVNIGKRPRIVVPEGKVGIHELVFEFFAQRDPLIEGLFVSRAQVLDRFRRDHAPVCLVLQNDAFEVPRQLFRKGVRKEGLIDADAVLGVAMLIDEGRGGIGKRHAGETFGLVQVIRADNSGQLAGQQLGGRHRGNLVGRALRRRVLGNGLLRRGREPVEEKAGQGSLSLLQFQDELAGIGQVGLTVGKRFAAARLPAFVGVDDRQGHAPFPCGYVGGEVLADPRFLVFQLCGQVGTAAPGMGVNPVKDRIPLGGRGSVAGESGKGKAA